MTRNQRFRLLGVMALTLFVAGLLCDSANAIGRRSTIVNAGGVSVQHRQGLFGRHQTIVNTGAQGLNSSVFVRHGLLGRHQTIVNGGGQNLVVAHNRLLPGRRTIIVNGNQPGVTSSQYLFAPAPQRLLLNQLNTYTANPVVGSANLLVTPGYSYTTTTTAPANVVTSQQYVTAAPATTTTTETVTTQTPPPPPPPPQYQTAPATQYQTAPQYVTQQPQFVVQPQYVVQQPVVSYLVNEPAYLATGVNYGCHASIISNRRQLIVNGY